MSTNAHYHPALVGRRAPAFEVKSTRGPGHGKTTVCLEDYRDRWLILMFYPQDFSLVCPTELSAMSDRYEEFAEHNAEVLASFCSTDDIFARSRPARATSSQRPRVSGEAFEASIVGVASMFGISGSHDVSCEQTVPTPPVVGRPDKLALAAITRARGPTGCERRSWRQLSRRSAPIPCSCI